ncbi:hypothetical protein C4552_00855 [Candidatus Parcubacteria bacterium]|nr:MAG: hypothetical protein C4552_00855 [Candidatus Parcubacteria bacterium]
MRLTPDKHLHSREHLLADDLSRMMLEPRRFGAYLGISERYFESDLRALARRVLEKPDLEPAHRGRYFFAALKGLAPRPDWKPRPRKRRKAKIPNAKTTHRAGARSRAAQKRNADSR